MFPRITAAAQEIIAGAFSLPDAVVNWERPAQMEHGDLASSAALRLAKQVGTPPREIAQVIADGLAGHPDIAKAEVAGAGYVNIWLTTDALLASLQSTRDACIPAAQRPKEDPVIVEYSQPNIAKPLGVHHILSTVIGQSLANMIAHTGTPVLRWNYIGDWGTQFGKLAVAYERWGARKPVVDYSLDELLDLYVRFHAEAENDDTLDDAGREAFRKLEQGDEALRAFWRDVVTVTKASLGALYARLHVTFDCDLGESFYEDNMAEILEEGIRKKVFTEGEGGALIVQFPEETGYPPYMVRKSDGATLYSTRDIAQMRYRIDHDHPQEILICTDVAQRLHFQQLEETCRLLQWDLPRFENVWFGRMRFADASMSTRKGNILKLESVLDEAVKRARDVIAARGDAIQTDDPEALAEMMGVGALVYGILSQNRTMDLVFDWDKFLSFEGNSAPYMQYTHARARSVLRKADAPDSAVPSSAPGLEAHDRALIGELLEFPRVLSTARTTHMPHTLANYLYALCQRFNAFYNAVPILQADDAVRTLRLGLTQLTAAVLRCGAELLTLRVPDRM